MSIEGLVRVQVERAERYPLEGQGSVRTAAQLPATVTIVNLSRSGCLFRSAEQLAPGTPISVSIPGIGQRAAIVMRAAADGTGCAFTTPLRQADIEAALATKDGEDDRASRVMQQLRRASASVSAEETGRRSSFLSRLRARVGAR